MTISYRNGFRDRLAFAAYTVPRQPLIILMSIAFFLVVTFGAVAPAMREASSDKPPALLVIEFILKELSIVAFIVALTAIATTLTMISRKNESLYCQRTLTIAGDVFIMESEYGRSETRWTLVQKLVRTRSHIFMFLSQQSAVVIPRRAFESAAQWETFYEECRRNKSRDFRTAC